MEVETSLDETLTLIRSCSESKKYEKPTPKRHESNNTVLDLTLTLTLAPRSPPPVCCCLTMAPSCYLSNPPLRHCRSAPNETENSVSLHCMSVSSISMDSHESFATSSSSSKKTVEYNVQERLQDEFLPPSKKTKNTNNSMSSGLKPNRLTKKASWKNEKHGVIDGPNPAPDLPAALSQRIEREFGGHVMKMILQRRLSKTDIDRGQNRFSMTVKQLASDDFLSKQEKDECCQRKKDKDGGLIPGKQVRLIAPRGDDTCVQLKVWSYSSSSSYVFCKNWGKIVEENELKVDQIVQVWFFRDSVDQPCFAMVNLSG